MSWTYVGALLSRTASGDLGPNRVVERPKVIYNSSTKKYVLYMHIDDSSYGEAKVGVATGDSVCGKYTYISSWRPLGFQSRDIGLYQDDDGKAYLLTEDVSLTICFFLSMFLLHFCRGEILTNTDSRSVPMASGSTHSPRTTSTSRPPSTPLAATRHPRS